MLLKKQYTKNPHPPANNFICTYGNVWHGGFDNEKEGGFLCGLDSSFSDFFNLLVICMLLFFGFRLFFEM